MSQNITSKSPGLTAGQQQAYAGLEHYQNSALSDWIPNEADYGTGLDAWLAADPTLSALASAGDGVDPSSYNKARQDAIAKYQGHTTSENAATVRQGVIDDTQKSVDWWNANPNGDDDFLDRLMKVAIPALVGGIVGGGVLGLYGEGAAGATAGGAGSTGGLASGVGSAGADVALGSLPTSGFGLDSLAWADGLGGAGTAGAAGGLGSGAAGLGSMVGVEGGAPAVVTIGAPAATAGSGLSGAGAIGAGLGLENILGNNPQLPVDRDLLSQMPNIQNPDPMGLGGTLPVPQFGVPTNINAGTPSGTGTTATPGGTSGIPGGLGGLGSLPGAIGSAIGGIGDIIGGNVDRIKNQQDQEYWQNYMDKMTSMYMPGTPEANLMRGKVEAQDAAAGRNSQYGVREQNLAGMLAQQRANIMTSPSFYNMGAASRGHYDNSLNSLFGALGSATSGGGLGGLMGNIGNIGSSLYNMFNGSSTPPMR
jgi:hypothetical protein